MLEKYEAKAAKSSINGIAFLRRTVLHCHILNSACISQSIKNY